MPVRRGGGGRSHPRSRHREAGHARQPQGSCRRCVARVAAARHRLLRGVRRSARRRERRVVHEVPQRLVEQRLRRAWSREPAPLRGPRTRCRARPVTAATRTATRRRFDSHVPPPPEIGDRERQRNNRTAWFNKLTLTGMDTYPDYEVDGVTYTALDYLQFVNPGDLRVVTQGRSCGTCHAATRRWSRAAAAGDLDRHLLGRDLRDGRRLNSVPEHVRTCSATRPRTSPSGRSSTRTTCSTRACRPGRPAASSRCSARAPRRARGPIHRSDDYLAAGLADDQLPDGRVITGLARWPTCSTSRSRSPAVTATSAARARTTATATSVRPAARPATCPTASTAAAAASTRTCRRTSRATRTTSTRRSGRTSAVPPHPQHREDAAERHADRGHRRPTPARAATRAPTAR